MKPQVHAPALAAGVLRTVTRTRHSEAALQANNLAAMGKQRRKKKSSLVRSELVAGDNESTGVDDGQRKDKQPSWSAAPELQGSQSCCVCSSKASGSSSKAMAARSLPVAVTKYKAQHSKCSPTNFSLEDKTRPDFILARDDWCIPQFKPIRSSLLLETRVQPSRHPAVAEHYRLPSPKEEPRAPSHPVSCTAINSAVELSLGGTAGTVRTTLQ